MGILTAMKRFDEVSPRRCGHRRVSLASTLMTARRLQDEKAERSASGRLRQRDHGDTPTFDAFYRCAGGILSRRFVSNQQFVPDIACSLVSNDADPQSGWRELSCRCCQYARQSGLALVLVSAALAAL